MSVVRGVALILGAVLVVGTMRSAIRTLVLPRAAPSLLVRLVFLAWRVVYDVRGSDRFGYAQRDRTLATFAPVGLLTLPLAWLAMAATGFAAILWGLGAPSVAEAAVTSGSSILTLGFARPSGALPVLVTFLEAGLGLGLVGLLISYLPTIYAAFSRRETAVALLEGLAGSPPSPVELLVRHQRIGGIERLGDLWERWQEWFADLQESHASVPALCFFRSPRPEHSWVTAAGCVLDAAALRLSSLETPDHGAGAALCVRSGFLSLRHIADFFAIPYDPDPAPDDPISVSRQDFDRAWEELAAGGLPMRPDREEAWRAFAGWRVNYDAVLLALSGLTVAAPAGWPAAPPTQYRRPRLGAAVSRPRLRRTPNARG